MQINRTSPILAMCFVGFLSLNGCLDITSTSQVNSNGTIVRTITFSGDSAEVCEGKFPIALDSSWTRNITRLSPKSTKDFKLTASRTFQNVEEMNGLLGGTFGRTLQYRFGFDKSFQWFFTVYRYREINIPFDQFTAIPITDFASSAEIEWLTKMMLKNDTTKELTTRGDSLAFESLMPRIQEAEWRNRFEAVFTAFLDGLKTVNDPTLTPKMVEPLRDSLYKRSAKAIDKKKIDTLRIIFSRVLRNPVVDKAWQANVAGFNEIKRKIEFEEKTNSHKYVTSVVMPGIITGSNARKIEGNTATWEDFKDYSRHLEYTMWVESRQVNWWAVIIALVVVVSLMAMLILSVLRRKRQV